MAYTIKPSIGMLPIEDIDKAMVAQGFVKGLTANDIEEVTQEKDPITGAVKTPGITDPSRIAVCAGIKNSNGTIDRETIKNALKLNGKGAEEFLDKEDKDEISEVINLINKAHSDEIQLLRDELYHLKAELVKTGTVEDTSVADGYIDGFKHSNVKYNTAKTELETVNGLIVRQVENIFDKNDWLVVRKDKTDVQSNVIASVTKETGNDLQLDIGTANLSEDKTMLFKSLGEYNRGTYSFSKVSYGTPSSKENYTMLNDDSNIYKHKIDSSYTGFATVIKIPNRCAGFLTKFSVHGKAFGNPGSLTCHVIKGSYEYINQLAKTNGLSQATADGNLIAKSSPVNANIKDDEIVFDFTKLDYDTNDSTSTLYPEVEGIEYCFVIEADNVNSQDYWQLEFGHKKNAPVDLQTNNKTFKFYNKDLISVTENSFVEIPDIDMLYMAVTKPKMQEDEVPYSTGLYTTLNPIKLSAPIKASRARLTLEVNKEGNFVTVDQGVIRAELDTIEFRNFDGSYAEQTVLGGGDHVIIGNNIAKVKTSTPNTVTIDKNIYVLPMTPIYRCGYAAQIKTHLIEEAEDGSPTIVPGSEKIYPLELVAVIPSGRSDDSSVSDRLIFEVNIDNTAKEITYFNEAELQIKWNSFLSSNIIHSQASKGNDYVGRIHSLSLAFDKIV